MHNKIIILILIYLNFRLETFARNVYGPYEEEAEPAEEAELVEEAEKAGQ